VEAKKLTAVANIKVKIKVINDEDDDAFLIFAKKHYFNPHCTSNSEFFEDLKRIKYVKRLLFRFHKARSLKSIKERLIINHLIVLRNVFGDQPAAEMLFLKHETKFHSYLKSFLVFLNFKLTPIVNVDYPQLSCDPRIDRKLSLITEKQ
jgi:hypothetical protein